MIHEPTATLATSVVALDVAKLDAQSIRQHIEFTVSLKTIQNFYLLPFLVTC